MKQVRLDQLFVLGFSDTGVQPILLKFMHLPNRLIPSLIFGIETPAHWLPVKKVSKLGSVGKENTFLHESGLFDPFRHEHIVLPGFLGPQTLHRVIKLNNLHLSTELPKVQLESFLL
jgi:hypothetical protein